VLYPLGYRIKFQLPFNNIKWLSDYSRRWQVKGYLCSFVLALELAFGVLSLHVNKHLLNYYFTVLL
jgi:hypothetical protein